MKHFEIQVGFHHQDLRQVFRFVTLVFCQQNIEFLEIIGKVGL